MKATTTLKLPAKLKARIAKIAKKTSRTPHAFMIEALERQASREERFEAFVAEALASDRAIEDGDEVYAADDVHAWLERLATSSDAPRPKPWRG
jgi:predicted transcriptional regulator